MPDSPSQTTPIPPVDGVLTMFYYNDLQAAADWYHRVLGFEKILIAEGLVLFRIHEGSQLALVGKGYGSQQPLAGTNKGAILSIQTRALQQWHERIASHEAEGIGHELHRGGNGRTVEFKVRDPEGYTIEFFEWVE
ncbi:VOC family protein [Allosphingosinicella indica]|nr:VOC family protein [Allosphingosinicella indica]